MSNRNWKRRTRLLRWSAPAGVALAATWGYWLMAGGCAPGGGNGDGNGGGDDNLVINASSCTQTDEAGNEFEVMLQAVSAGGRQLVYTRRVITNPDTDTSFRIETEVTSGGQQVVSIVTQSGSAGVSTQVDYGPLVPGLDSAEILVQSGMVSGMIDGRTIVPVPADQADPAATAFQDGAPPPAHGMDADLESALTQLLSAASNAAQTCTAAPAVSMKSAALLPVAQREVDTGHDSDPESSAACVGCWAGCSTGAAVCIGAVSAGCAASLIFYAVCEAIGVAACAVAYLGCVGGCNATGAPCCPVACGEVACCASDETCLNAQIGLCCSPGKTPCVGEECCSSTQVCIGSGPNAGVCCEPENICGNTCCEPTDACIAEANLCCPAGNAPCNDKCCAEGEVCLGNGLCCRADLACGSACCDELDSACIPGKSLCCGFSTVACGDQCCAIGEGCVNGACCPQERICPGMCCPEGTGCNTQTNQCTACPNPGEKFCQESNSCCPTDKVCTPVAGTCCEAGEFYCFGACRHPSECIK